MTLWLALLLALPVSAEIKSISGFRGGGLNTFNASVLLKDNESPDLQNVLLDESGGITKRKGSSNSSSSSGPQDS